MPWISCTIVYPVDLAMIQRRCCQCESSIEYCPYQLRYAVFVIVQVKVAYGRVSNECQKTPSNICSPLNSISILVQNYFAVGSDISSAECRWHHLVPQTAACQSFERLRYICGIVDDVLEAPRHHHHARVRETKRIPKNARQITGTREQKKNLNISRVYTYPSFNVTSWPA